MDRTFATTAILTPTSSTYGARCSLLFAHRNDAVLSLFDAANVVVLYFSFSCVLGLTRQMETADFAPPPNNTASRATQSNRLLLAADESISLRQGVTMTTAAESLYIHRYVKT